MDEKLIDATLNLWDKEHSIDKNEFQKETVDQNLKKVKNRLKVLIYLFNNRFYIRFQEWHIASDSFEKDIYEGYIANVEFVKSKINTKIIDDKISNESLFYLNKELTNYMDEMIQMDNKLSAMNV